MTDDNVIPLKPVEREVHVTGDAKCTVCGHKWVVVAPAGISIFECPACSLHQGVFMNPCIKDGEPFWTCDCSNEFFVIHKSEIICSRCGLAQTGMFD